MGKGSKQRPRNISWEEYSKNWDSIFGKDKDDELRREHSTDEEKESGIKESAG